MHNQTPQKTPGKPKQQPVPPELADPPGRKVRSIFICRCRGCGTTNVNYADENEPAACRNARCSGVVQDGGPRWLRSRMGDPQADPSGPLQSAPQALGRVPAPLPPAPEEPPFVDIKSPAAETSPPATRKITAEEYRSEWVSERVSAMVDSGEYALEPENSASFWDLAEKLYDEGRARGHLP